MINKDDFFRLIYKYEHLKKVFISVSLEKYRKLLIIIEKIQHNLLKKFIEKMTKEKLKENSKNITEDNNNLNSISDIKNIKIKFPYNLNKKIFEEE